MLVSDLHSHSRVLDLVLQFCINFDVASWGSLGVVSKSRHTLHILLSFFFLFFLKLLQAILGSVPHYPSASET